MRSLLLTILMLTVFISSGLAQQVNYEESLKQKSIQEAVSKTNVQYKSAFADSIIEGTFEQFTPTNTGSNGLSNQTVRFTFEDSNGNLYFGTRGIDRLADDEWENLSPINSDFPANAAYDALEDQNGNIWFATYGGVAILHTDTDEIEVIHPDNSDIRSNRTYTLHQDTAGNIYAGHNWDDVYEGGITVFNSDYEIVNTISGESGLYGDSIEDFVISGDSVMYIATGADPQTGEFGGVNVWNLNTASVDTFYNMDNSDLPFNEVSSLEIDADGNLWAGFYLNTSIGHDVGGLAEFDGSTWTHHTVGNAIRDIMLDSEGLLWIASSEGVLVYEDDTFTEVFDGDIAFPTVVSITELSDGRIALSKFQAEFEDGGVSIFNPQDDSWEHLSTRDGGINSWVKFGADYDSQGNLWTSGFHGLQKFDGQTWETWTAADGLTDTYGWDLIVDSDDNVWVNGAQNGINRISPDGSLETITEYGEFVESNWEARNGDLWFGSWYDDYNGDGVVEANGMLRFDGENYTVYDSTDGLPSDQPIVSIAEDQEGRILAASYSGLYRLENDTFTKWEFEDYSGGAVPKLHLDSQDRLWIIDDNLSMYDGENWTHFDADSIGFGYSEDIEHDIDGRVWFAQDDGAYIYDDGAFYRVNAESGFPTGSFFVYDLAPSPTNANEMAFATYNGGVIIMNRMTTSSEPVSSTIPQGFVLSQNYPNPFNPSTNINYSIPQASNVKITVYNTLGQQVAVLVDGMKSAGNHQLNFNAEQLNSGMYFYRIEAGSFTQTRKMMLIK